MSDHDQQQQTGQQPAHTREREPMTAERLAAIRERAEARPLLDFGGVDQPGNGPGARQRVQACFADRWTLLAFAEAALPILRAVAEFSGVEYPLPFTQLPDGRLMAVMPDNLRTTFAQARALLVRTTETSARAEGANERSEQE